MNNSRDKDEAKRKREVAAVSAPTPGEMIMGSDDGFSVEEESAGVPLPATTPGAVNARQAILHSLQQQQEAMDTIRAGNIRSPTRQGSGYSSSSDGSELQGLAYNNGVSLEELFQRPFTAPLETGVLDFRAALLAEQQQQEAILRDRQRKFEEQNPSKGSESPKPSSVPSSPALSSTRAPSPPIPRAAPPAANKRPSALTNSNRQRSIPKGQANGPSHNRTVSWSLDKLESTAPIENISSQGNSKTGSPQLNSRPRPKLLTEDSFRLNKRFSLKDVVGMTPFESEAETNIMAAVDEFGLEQQYTITTGDEGPFFSNLPRDFTIPPDGDDSLQDSIVKRSGHHQKSLSELTGGSALGAEFERPTVVERQSPIPRPEHIRKPTHLGRSRRLSVSARPKGHRRKMTVEEKLFGLTSQLNRLDEDAFETIKKDDSFGDDFVKNWLGAEQQQEKSSIPEGKKSHRRVMSTAERLAENADALVNNALNESKHTIGSASFHPWSAQSTTDIEAPNHENADQQSTGTKDTPRNKAKTRLETWMGSGDSHGSPGGLSPPPTPRSQRSLHEKVENGIAAAEGNEKVRDDSEKRRSKMRYSHRNAADFLTGNFKGDWETFNNFLNPRKKSIVSYLRTVLGFVVLPSLAAATIVFYFLENPDAFKEEEVVNPRNQSESASISWLILFVGVRQVVTFSLALALQGFLIDFILLGSRFSLRLLGPITTLLLVQSKGWPFVVTMWALLDMGLLAGDSDFVRHWCYWQDWIGLFNATNPAGGVTNSDFNYRILRLAASVGAIVAIKRLVVGVFLSRQTFLNYSAELTKVMSRMVLVSEVAALSRQPIPHDEEEEQFDTNLSWRQRDLSALMSLGDESTETGAAPTSRALELPHLEDLKAFEKKSSNMADRGTDKSAPDASNNLSPKADNSVAGNRSDYAPPEKQLIIDLLERWEDPEKLTRDLVKKVSLGSVLQFRRALASLKRRYPFSPAFGPCDTREECIDSAQNIFERLLLRDLDSDEELNFDVLAALAVDEGEVDEDKIKELIKVFRPDRDGKISKLAFVKSIDVIYKRMRFLAANIHNSSQIDIAVENLLNVGFYFLIGCLCLAVLGVDPFQVFFSLSSFVLAFSFMFGSASSKYFEGVLFVLVQKPFGVGDRIHVANSESESSPDGSAGWIVEQVNLFNTTVCYGTTNERATISNGTLASSRIINAARSPNAVVYVNLKFGIDVPYDKVQIFQRACEEHVKARPREWLAFAGFRAGAISVDRGFIEYKVVVQHRESWQNIISILDSKARLTIYCLEVAKQLQMRYLSPPLPVDLNIMNSKDQAIADVLEQQNNPIDSVNKTA